MASLFRRRRDAGGLPTTSLPTSSSNRKLPFLGGPAVADGSSKSIHVEAPIVRSWRLASNYTRRTYYFMLFFVVLMYAGYKYMRINNASIWVNCQAQECTLDITPSGWRTRTVSATIARRQLLQAKAVKTDREGNFIQIDESRYDYRQDRRKNSKGGSNYKGPDAQGHYSAYAIVLADKKAPSEDQQQDEDNVEDADLSPLMPFLSPYEEEGDEKKTYMLVMRKFKVTQSRRRVRTMVTKVESYIKKRRHKLLVKENSPLPWQGIVMLVAGLFGLLFTIIAGQFWEDQHAPPPRLRQPPARNQPYGIRKKWPAATTTTLRSNSARNRKKVHVTNVRNY